MTFTNINPQEIEITPEQVAYLFSNMDSDEQARFFNKIDAIAKGWKFSLSSQLAEVENSPFLEEGGRRVMKTIGEFSTKEVL